MDTLSNAIEIAKKHTELEYLKKPVTIQKCGCLSCYKFYTLCDNIESDVLDFFEKKGVEIRKPDEVLHFSEIGKYIAKYSFLNPFENISNLNFESYDKKTQISINKRKKIKINSDFEYFLFDIIAVFDL